MSGDAPEAAEPAALARAREALARAEAILVTAGAGMGVDSGLPDFRGDQGFWKAYPPLARLGIRFVEMANPRWFRSDPTLAWGFYGHRLNLYRTIVPHAGFARLHARAMLANMPGGIFAFTSNVDGHFQAAGFDPASVCEIHGSIRHLQCLEPDCASGIWDAPAAALDVDPETMRARGPLPLCPACGGLARPNILMFGDGDWRPERSAAQQYRLRDWLSAQRARRLVVLELGAGLAVPTVRQLSQHVAATHPAAQLVRVNPREADGPPGTIALSLGALAAIDALGL